MTRATTRDGDGEPPTARSQPPRILLALLTAVGLFGTVEVTLHALDLGAGRELFGNDAADATRYLVPGDVPGSWRTRFGGDDHPDVRVAPKGDAPRLVLLGASNARGFYDQLVRQAFRERCGAELDVVNLGRSGYGTERVKAIALEALAKLAPDYLSVYTGDNDFHDLAGFRSSRVVDARLRQDRRILGLRTVGLVRELLAEDDPSTPAIWAPPAEDELRMLSLADTRAHQERTRANLEAIVRAAREHGARVVLSTVLYNRMHPPASSTLPTTLSTEDRQRVTRLLRQAEELVPPSLRPLFSDRHTYLRAKDWNAVRTKPAALPEHDPDSWRRPTAPPLDSFARFNHAPWRWSHAAWDVVASLQRIRKAELDAAERADLAAMEARLEELLASCEDHPRGLWLLGLAKLALGRDGADVERCLRLASDYDRSPRKANATLNGIVRDVARAHPEVLLVDADARVAALCEDGVIGYEWMMDNCHMHVGVRRWILAEVAAALCERWPLEAR